MQDSLAMVEDLFAQLGRTWYEVLEAAERQLGISYARLMLLTRLQALGEVSQVRLQHELHVDGAAISRQVKQLEREGLVTRRTNPADNRFTLVTLTTAGRELVERLAGARPEFYQRARSDLTPEELAAVRTVLQRLQTNLAAMPVETAGQRQRG
ncbi:MAG: hypothetical protein KatS3mg061_0438 [Dehalococcoidia bacterium]|nr:MAG: hypothetical protein KatS3mg061_0438 [Dehalococcoidia bacterium]